MTIECLSVQRLVAALELHHPLHWLAGHAGERRCVGRIADKPDTSLIGRLNLIHPPQIQVLGKDELAYLTSLGHNSRDDFIARLFAEEPAMIIVADDCAPPPEFCARADADGIPLLASSHAATDIITRIGYFLGHELAESVTLHGVFMEVMGIGVLLSGEAGVGKSELALELISRGHRLIADDAPEFARIAPDILRGACPPVLQDFLEVRGLGILNIRALYGDSAIKTNKNLRLVIRLEPGDAKSAAPLDRLHGDLRTQQILGLDIPVITLPVAPGRNLAVLVEAAVRNHLLRTRGYEAARDLIRRQRQSIEQDRRSCDS